tara:strand:- start:1135 stop:1383 length:249 start_codon:yes stop_codon:yes gene_type:complete
VGRLRHASSSQVNSKSVGFFEKKIYFTSNPSTHPLRRRVNIRLAGVLEFGDFGAKLVEVVPKVCSVTWHDRRTVVVGNRREP